MQESSSFFINKDKASLIPGEISESHFWLLIELSPIRSEKVVRALMDFLVLGYTRGEACEKYKVSLSYFSVSLKRLTHVNNIVGQMASYYLFEH